MTTEHEKIQNLAVAVFEALSIEVRRNKEVEDAMLSLGIAPDEINEQLELLAAAIVGQVFDCGVVAEACVRGGAVKSVSTSSISWPGRSGKKEEE